MGQYYRPMVISEDGTVNTLSAHEYDNGLKLMEHSYIGNNFMDAVIGLIWKNPMGVAWIGDYSDAYDGHSAYEKKMTQPEFLECYDKAWGDGCGGYQVHPNPVPELTLEKMPGRYIVNHTRLEYIDMDAYMLLNIYEEKGCWANGSWDPNGTSTGCIHPLSLLTACGNNRGGGDYHEQYPDFGAVGTWAFDKIELTDVLPMEYDSVMFRFSEKRQ